jgi:hypothetical protein
MDYSRNYTYDNQVKTVATGKFMEKANSQGVCTCQRMNINAKFVATSLKNFKA